MPITQDRMLSLINAALAYQHAFEDLQRIVYEHRRYAQEAYESPSKSKGDVFRFFQELEVFIHEKNLAVNSLEHKIVIAVEHNYFKRFAKRNHSEAVRQARRRGKLPTQKYLDKMASLEFPSRQGRQSDNAPSSLIAPDHIGHLSPYRQSEAALAAIQSESAVHINRPSIPPNQQYNYEAESAAHRVLSAKAAAELKGRYTPEQLAAAAAKAEAEAAAEEAELDDFINSPDTSHQPDMLQDLTSSPVQQFTEEVFDIPKPANAAELDILIEQELKRQKAREEYEALNSPPATSPAVQPPTNIDTKELEQ